MRLQVCQRCGVRFCRVDRDARASWFFCLSCLPTVYQQNPQFAAAVHAAERQWRAWKRPAVNADARPF